MVEPEIVLSRNRKNQFVALQAAFFLYLIVIACTPLLFLWDNPLFREIIGTLMLALFLDNK